MYSAWLQHDWNEEAFLLTGKQETYSPSVGLANSFGTAAPSSSSIGSSSVRTPSIWISCSPEMTSSSDLELSPVRRNLTTLTIQKQGSILWWDFSGSKLCLVSLEALFGQTVARFLPTLLSPFHIHRECCDFYLYSLLDMGSCWLLLALEKLQRYIAIWYNHHFCTKKMLSC